MAEKRVLIVEKERLNEIRDNHIFAMIMHSGDQERIDITDLYECDRRAVESGDVDRLCRLYEITTRFLMEDEEAVWFLYENLVELAVKQGYEQAMEFLFDFSKLVQIEDKEVIEAMESYLRGHITGLIDELADEYIQYGKFVVEHYSDDMKYLKRAAAQLEQLVELSKNSKACFDASLVMIDLCVLMGKEEQVEMWLEKAGYYKDEYFKLLQYNSAWFKKRFLGESEDSEESET